MMCSCALHIKKFITILIDECSELYIANVHNYFIKLNLSKQYYKSMLGQKKIKISPYQSMPLRGHAYLSVHKRAIKRSCVSIGTQACH